MENNSSNSQENFNSNYSNEKVRKYLQEFFEVEDIWTSPTMDLIKKEYKEDTLIDKYQCEDKYTEVIRCLDKVAFNTLSRCEQSLEDLGRCIFDRIKISKMKK